MNPKAFAYLSAVLSGICGNLAAFGFIPSEFMPLAGGVCATLLSLGIVSASHSDGQTPMVGVAGKFSVLFLAVAMAGFVAACSQTELKKSQQVIAAVDKDLKTVVITGCKDAPIIKIGLDTVSGLYPPSTAAITVAEGLSEAFCTRALQLSQAEAAAASGNSPPVNPGVK